MESFETEGKAMRVVIDMQGAQTPFSSSRGVGRYTKEMVKAFIRVCKKQDEVFLALNGFYEEACNRLIGEFEELLPRNRIKVWQWYPVQEPACLAGVSEQRRSNGIVNGFYSNFAQILFGRQIFRKAFSTITSLVPPAY